MAESGNEVQNVLNRKLYNESETEKLFFQFVQSGLYFKEKEDYDLVVKAWEVAKRVHKEQTRKTGDCFLYHLYNVMVIVTENIGLGTTGAVCALLHEISFQTEYKAEDIRNIFGEKVYNIIYSLEKIKGLGKYFQTKDNELYKKIIFSLSSDIRIILIKLADRLDNMRNLEIQTPAKRFEVAQETMGIFVPIAHRLGISKIKAELEELSFRYTNPKEYKEITTGLQISQSERKNFINKFTLPIIAKLIQNDIKFDIKGRLKSVYSIYQKMIKKKVTFDEVYDKFAIRIIFAEEDPDKEKDTCMKIVSVLKQDFDIHPDRTRDWINFPKDNGYMAYHVTVFDKKSRRWVEIQIRSERMDEIAEYGFAAHWKYKGIKDKKMEFDDKLKLLKEKLEDPQNQNFDFLEDFKLLMSDEISVYNKNGEVYTMPSGSTVLDYAFLTDSNQAIKIIGAKVNTKITPIDTILKNGDRVEIVTASKQTIKPEWLNIIHTKKAVEILKVFLGEIVENQIIEGQQKMHELLQKYKVSNEKQIMPLILNDLKLLTKKDLYSLIAQKKINISVVENAIKKHCGNRLMRFWNLSFGKDNHQENDEDLKKYLANENIENVEYQIAPCCTPTPGEDEIIGVLNEEKIVVIHKSNCLFARLKVKENARSLIPVKWNSSLEMSKVAKITIEGMEQQGIALKIINAISQELNLNLKTIHIESDDEMFTGYIEVHLRKENHLENLVNKISEIEGIYNIMVE